MGNNRKDISNKNSFLIHNRNDTRVLLVGFAEIHIKSSGLYLYGLQTLEKNTHEWRIDNVPKEKPQKKFQKLHATSQKSHDNWCLKKTKQK